MKINVVGHLAVRTVVQMKLHLVAFADTDETSGHLAAESPELILDAIGEFAHNLLHFERHDDLRGVRALDGRRDVWSLREHGFFFADDGFIGGGSS